MIMRAKSLTRGIVAGALLFSVSCSSSAAAPVVTNVKSSQIPGTHKVEVLYDLVADRECTVATEVSMDGGVTYGVVVPSEAFTGAIGAGVLSGTGKRVVFDAANGPFKQLFSKQIRFKVSARGIDLSEGLVANYPFDGDANDASGNGNDGNLHGGVTFVPGRAGLAAQFNEANGFVSVANCPKLDLTNKFTVSAWIFQSASQGGGYRIVDKCPAGTAAGWTFDTYGNHGTGHQLRFQTVGPSVLGLTDYSLSVWHHIVGTVSGTTVKVYVDGLQDGEGIVGQIPSNTLDIFIGALHAYGPWGVQEYFNGLIDDVRIYNRALSASEVEQLYNYSEPH